LFSRKNKLSGLTLLELLIACSLSLVLIISLTASYLTAYQAQQIQSAFVTQQEQATLVIQRLNLILRSAGYHGCGASNDRLYPKIEIKQINHSDSLTVWQASHNRVTVMDNMKNFYSIRVEPEPHLSIGDQILISDCETVEMGQVREIVFEKNQQILLLSQPLNKLYQRYAEVSKIAKITFFVSESHKKPFYALYQQINAQPKQEWVTGIKKINIHYDHDHNSVAIQLTFSPNFSFLVKHWYSYVALRN